MKARCSEQGVAIGLGEPGDAGDLTGAERSHAQFLGDRFRKGGLFRCDVVAAGLARSPAFRAEHLVHAGALGGTEQVEVVGTFDEGLHGHAVLTLQIE